MEPMLRIPVTVSIASEFRYEDPLIDSSTLVIVISQSGETIDTLAAMNLAKSLGSVTLSIVNVKVPPLPGKAITYYIHMQALRLLLPVQRLIPCNWLPST